MGFRKRKYTDDGISHLIIAIVVGSTYTSVAYTLQKGTASKFTVQDINCISNFPGFQPIYGFPVYIPKVVPTKLSYDDGTRTRTVITDPQTSDGDSSWSSDEDDSEQNDGYYCDADAQENNPFSKQRWGYEVQDHSEAQSLENFTILLGQDGSEESKLEHKNLRAKLQSLCDKNLILKETDIYRDFLIHLLRHTEAELAETLSQDTSVEFVLSVSAKWTDYAHKTMRNALIEATSKTKFLAKYTNISTIRDSEAAAIFTLVDTGSESLLKQNDVVVVLDLGGNTFRAATYRSRSADPSQLLAEPTIPESNHPGARFINKRFYEKIFAKLAKEQYLETNGKTLKSISLATTTGFEHYYKRMMDVRKKNSRLLVFSVDNLQTSSSKHFERNKMIMKWRNMLDFFKPSLDGVAQVLRDQLDATIKNGLSVRKIILTGGFGQSLSVRSLIEELLKEHKSNKGDVIELFVSEHSFTAAARGSVLLTLGKTSVPTVSKKTRVEPI